MMISRKNVTTYVFSYKKRYSQKAFNAIICAPSPRYPPKKQTISTNLCGLKYLRNNIENKKNDYTNAKL